MCKSKYKIEGGELIVETRFSSRPLQIVKLSEVTGITVLNDLGLLSIIVIFAVVSALSLLTSLIFGLAMAFITLLLLWQYIDRGKVTLIHARSHTLVLRGKHSDIWEKIKEGVKNESRKV